MMILSGLITVDDHCMMIVDGYNATATIPSLVAPVTAGTELVTSLKI
jgi:hypothetical protein